MGYQEDKLIEAIIQCTINDDQTPGTGFLESAYRKALLIEMRKRNHGGQNQKEGNPLAE